MVGLVPCILVGYVVDWFVTVVLITHMVYVMVVKWEDAKFSHDIYLI